MKQFKNKTINDYNASMKYNWATARLYALKDE